MGFLSAHLLVLLKVSKKVTCMLDRLLRCLIPDWICLSSNSYVFYAGYSFFSECSEFLFSLDYEEEDEEEETLSSFAFCALMAFYTFISKLNYPLSFFSFFSSLLMRPSCSAFIDLVLYNSSFSNLATASATYLFFTTEVKVPLLSIYLSSLFPEWTTAFTHYFFFSISTCFSAYMVVTSAFFVDFNAVFRSHLPSM